MSSYTTTVLNDQRKSNGTEPPRSSSASSDFPLPTKTRHPFLVPCRRRPRRAARRSEVDFRASMAIELNNAAVTLLESGLRDREESAIDALRESIDVLASINETADDGGASDDKEGSSMLPIASAEARLELVTSEAREAAIAAKARKSADGEGAEGEVSQMSSSPFLCAKPVRMRDPRRRFDFSGGGSRRSSSPPPPSPQGLLSVVSYNLGLAYQLLGGRLGRQALIDRATQFYKKSESIVLSIADEMEYEQRVGGATTTTGGKARRRSLLPPGVDVTYLARAIVNNMGLILFEWGEPDAAREYFEGLKAISVNNYGRCDEEEEEEEKEEGDGGDGERSKGHVFAVNALVARSTISSAAA